MLFYVKKKSGESSQNDDSMNTMFNNTSKLTSAVSSLPELLEMKRLLDMHTNIATALLDVIKVNVLKALNCINCFLVFVFFKRKEN